MIGGASTEEFLRTSANEEMLGGDENDPILAGIDDFLVDQQGVPDVGVDHQGVTITQERGFFDEDDDDDDEVLDGVPSGDDGDDDDLRSPFTLGADMRRSTHGDAHQICIFWDVAKDRCASFFFVARLHAARVQALVAGSA